MKVLLTGSGGFLGKEVAKALKAKHHSVVEYDITNGKNILNEEQLLTEMKKANAVVHLAGIVENDNPSLWKINIEGTQKVASAAKKAKIKKLIFMSSTGVYGFTKGEVNEKTLVHPENNYEKSKAEGEKIVLSVMDSVSVCIIRSAMIFGANEYWRKMFSMLEKNYPLPCDGNNAFQIIYSKELARGVVNILEKGENGEIYLISGKEKKTLNEFCEMVQAELKLKKGVKHIPTFLGVIIGKILGMKVLTLENIRHLSKERNYDTKKIAGIGYRQKISLKSAIKEVANELNKNKKK
ncbi:MAG: NAD(P)-dependent oxidoreductase [archaeon]|jgi:dTDP-4-dehydrorhamnose reductase